MTAMHHVATHNGRIIGEASSKTAAIRACRDAGFSVIGEGNGGSIDFYDAEDGPRVQGYEPDGRGVWIVTCK